jgi:hypothetical protein
LVVFNGTFVMPAGLIPGDWIEIPLSTSFTYDGKRNLAIWYTYGGGAANAYLCRLTTSNATLNASQLGTGADGDLSIALFNFKQDEAQDHEVMASDQSHGPAGLAAGFLPTSEPIETKGTLGHPIVALGALLLTLRREIPAIIMRPLLLRPVRHIRTGRRTRHGEQTTFGLPPVEGVYRVYRVSLYGLLPKSLYDENVILSAAKNLITT